MRNQDLQNIITKLVMSLSDIVLSSFVLPLPTCGRKKNLVIEPSPLDNQDLAFFASPEAQKFRGGSETSF